MRKFFLYFLLASFLFLFSFACLTLKRSSSNSNILGIISLRDSTLIKQFHFNSLSAKFSVKYKGKSKSLSLKGNMKIIKDSVIWISLSPGLGIEAARVLCTKDSIFLLNRLDKTITKANYSYLKKMWQIDADYNSLECILTNRFFIYPNNYAINASHALNDFSLKTDTSSLIIHRTNSEAINTTIKFNISSFLIYFYLIQDIKSKRNLLINYTSHFSDDYPNFPSVINITSSDKDNILKANLFYKRLKINNVSSYSFSIPSSYKLKIIK